MDESGGALARKKMPHQVCKSSGDFKPDADTIKLLIMHACRVLKFPVVALAGAEQLAAAGDDEKEEARLFYVAATRATQKLVTTTTGDSRFGKRLTGDKHGVA